jgi:hypothetical protein
LVAEDVEGLAGQGGGVLAEPGQSMVEGFVAVFDQAVGVQLVGGVGR